MQRQHYKAVADTEQVCRAKALQLYQLNSYTTAATGAAAAVHTLEEVHCKACDQVRPVCDGGVSMV
eukprot:20344-Heterococcus_DN1.PRE.2